MPNWKKVITSGSDASLNSLNLSGVVNANTDTDKFLVLDSAGNVDFRTGAQVLSDIGGQGNSPGTVSSSAQISGYNKFLEFTGDNVISSSAQLNNATIDGLNITNGHFTGSAKVDGTLTIGSQIIYPQGTNGFSVNENYDPSNNSLQTAYHYTSGTGRETVAFTLARTGQFTDGFGIYGTAANNTFVTFGEQSNTKFEWRRGIGIQPLDLDGGTLLATLTKDGAFSTIGGITGSILATNGVISSSAQLTTEFDTRYLNTTGDGVISSSAQLTPTFDTRYLNTTGDGVISSSAQVTISSTTGYTTFSSSIASDIAGLQGAGYVDGTGASNYLARFTDSNTLTGSREFQVNGSNYIAINGHSGAWNLATYAPVAPLTVRNGTDQGSGQPDHPISYFQVPNGRGGYLQFANGTYSTFAGQDATGDFFIGFGNATDRTFRFVNNGAGGVPTLSVGTLTISGSGTLKNIGPAQFSGSISITTANQVVASTDTDKFLVLDGQQIKYRSGTQILSDIDGVSTNTTQTITGIKTFSSDTTFNGDVIVGGRITAQEFNTEFVSSSIIFSSGSTKFGDSSDDKHDFTGSLSVNGGITIWNLNDPQLTFAGQGLASSIAMGIDDSDSDKFKISRSTALGTNDIYKYNYNGGNQNHTFAGDLVLTNSNVGFSGGQLVKINSSGFLVPAVANTDYVPTGSTPDIYVINPVQTYVDFKSQTIGALPFGGIVDLQPINKWLGVWIAPSAGYIDEIYVSPENTNATQDQFSIQMYINGTTQGTVQSQLMGAAGTNIKYTFGSTNYSFGANDRISLYLDKGNNDSDLYAFQVVFRVNN